MKSAGFLKRHVITVICTGLSEFEQDIKLLLHTITPLQHHCLTKSKKRESKRQQKNWKQIYQSDVHFQFQCITFLLFHPKRVFSSALEVPCIP